MRAWPRIGAPNRLFEAAHARLIEELDIDPVTARAILMALAGAADRARESSRSGREASMASGRPVAGA